MPAKDCLPAAPTAQPVAFLEDAGGPDGAGHVLDFDLKVVDPDDPKAATLAVVVEALRCRVQSLVEEVAALRASAGHKVGKADGKDAPARKGCMRNFLRRHAVKLDRFGDEEPRPKTVMGFFCTLLFFAGLVVYTIFLYLTYQATPPTSVSSVVWSVANGPYPLPLACYAERCMVSLNYFAGATDQGGECVSQIPASQLGKCLSMGPGEHLTVQVCYTQLPGQGIRLWSGGAPRWDADPHGAKLGVGSDVAALYGFASISDMALGGTSVMPQFTPIRAGVTLMTYVRTDNNTFKVGEPERERHEWFSALLAAEAPASDFSRDACAASASTMQSMQRASLVMAPAYTHIVVTPPPQFIVALLGQIGGASQAYSAALLLLLIVLYKAHDLLRSSTLARNVSDEEQQNFVSDFCKTVGECCCPG